MEFKSLLHFFTASLPLIVKAAAGVYCIVVNNSQVTAGLFFWKKSRLIIVAGLQPHVVTNMQAYS